MEPEVGSLTPGKQADLAIVSLTGSPLLPWEDPGRGRGSRRRAGTRVPYHRGRQDEVSERRIGMARASAKRGGRPQSNARQRDRQQAVAVQQEPPKKSPSYEDQLFFTRLRRRAKWVFASLAAVFAISFIFFGVGTGVSGGSVGDFLRDLFGGNGTETQSVADALGKVEDNPNDAAAVLALAGAYQRAGQTRDAAQHARELREAPAQGHGRSPAARHALPAAGGAIRPAGRRAHESGPRSVDQHDSLELPGGKRLPGSRRRQSHRRGRHGPSLGERHCGRRPVDTVVEEGRHGLRRARQGRPEQHHRADPARPGGVERRRRTKLQSMPSSATSSSIRKVRTPSRPSASSRTSSRAAPTSSPVRRYPGNSII